MTHVTVSEEFSKERRIAWFSDFYNYIYLRYDQIVEQLVCICVVNEQWVFEGTYDVPLSEWNGTDGLWHKLAIEIHGNTMSAYRDDQLIFEHTDPLISQMPKTGYLEVANTYIQTCFDDIILVSIENPPYTCGDANGDEALNVSDAVWIINYVFVYGDPPAPMQAGDANCDMSVNVSDAVWIINYVFIGGYDPCDTDGDGDPDC